jgi:hypothetical protein
MTMSETAQITLRSPAINIYSHDVMRLVGFYERLGFRETFRTPEQGRPVHVELSLEQFKIGVASVNASIADHGLSPDLGGRSIELVFWTDDVDRLHARLTADGMPSLSRPHDFLGGRLRAAWMADPRRKSDPVRPAARLIDGNAGSGGAVSPNQRAIQALAPVEVNRDCGSRLGGVCAGPGDPNQRPNAYSAGAWNRPS